MNIHNDEPCYVISIAAKMIGIHAQTLRYYERVGLIEPVRSQGNIRLYSNKDIEHIKHIKGLIDDLGVNLAGVEVIMHMAERLLEMQQQLEDMENELAKLQQENTGSKD
jgi:MerR family transcriptional regulator/heat shock protein HspR